MTIAYVPPQCKYLSHANQHVSKLQRRLFCITRSCAVSQNLAFTSNAPVNCYCQCLKTHVMVVVIYTVDFESILRCLTNARQYLIESIDLVAV